ncbi:hypothetical protein D3C75_761560 [compost metagenome]
MQVGAVKVTVRAGKINIFHRAQRFAFGFGESVFQEAVLVQHQQLAWLDITDQSGSDNFKGTGLGSEDIRFTKPAHHQRAQPVRVRGDDQLVISHQQEGEAADKLAERILGRFDKILRRARNQMRQHLSVTGRLEDRAAHLKRLADYRLINDVAVSGNRQIAVAVLED